MLATVMVACNSSDENNNTCHSADEFNALTGDPDGAADDHSLKEGNNDSYGEQSELTPLPRK